MGVDGKLHRFHGVHTGDCGSPFNRRFQPVDGEGGLGDEAVLLPGLCSEGTQNPVGVGGRKTRIHRFPGGRKEGVKAQNMPKLYLETCRRRWGKNLAKEI